MLAAILGILKTILFVILWIMLAVVVLLMLVLLWPVSYKITASNKDAIRLKARVSWLLGLIYLTADYDKGVNIKCRILGIPIYNNKGYKDKPGKIKKSKKSAKAGEYVDDAYGMMEHENAASSRNADEALADLQEEAAQADNKKALIEKQERFKNKFDRKAEYNGFLTKDETKEGKKRSKDKENKRKKRKNADTSGEECLNVKSDEDISLWDKITNWIQEFLENTNKKLEKIADNINYYKELFEKKGTEYVLQYVKDILIKLIRHIIPKKAHINVDYSSTSPDKVGFVCEIYGIALAYLPKGTTINVGYDDDKVTFDADVRGRIIIGYVAFQGLKLVLNKRVRKFHKLLKKEK